MTDGQTDCLAWGERHLRLTNRNASIATSLVKHRAWSTVWKLESQSRCYYLKAAAPGFDVEAPLLAALCRWRPSSIIELEAEDRERGWILTRDAGQMLHDVMFDDPEHGRTLLRSILLAYANVQADSLRVDAPPFARMLEDRSPQAIPQSFATVVADDALLLLGGATVDDLSRREHWLQRACELCGELHALGLPAALEHGDLHTSNFLIAADGAPRIADWGDACWATPLHALAMCLEDVIGRHKIADDDPWQVGLTQDYFDVWRHRGCDADFDRAFSIVRSLAPVSGVLRWSRGLNRMPADARATMAGQIVKYLRALH